MSIRYLSVCSGIEAATVAWEPLGWEPVAFSEIEPFPSGVLSDRWPQVPNLGDFTKITPEMLTSHPDVVVGGTPCQAFSVAGLRNSLEDDRGNLTLGFVHLVDRIAPSVVLWENVPGALSTKDNAFGWFLAGLVGSDDQLRPTGKRWTNAGLVSGPKRRVAWRVLDAQYFGVAQRRKRLFVVACPVDGVDPAAILLELEGVRRDTAPSRETRQGASETTRVDAALRDLLREELLEFGSELCGDGDWPAEVAATLRHENGSPGYANQDLFSQGGANLVPQIMASGQANSEFADDLCTTQSARQYKDPPILAYPMHDQVTRHSGKRGDRRDGKGNGLGIGSEADPMFTLTNGDHHIVAAETRPDDGVSDPDLADPVLASEHGTYTQEGKSFRLHNLVQEPFRKVHRAASKDDPETWAAAEVSNTLNCFDVGETRSTHLVAQFTRMVIRRLLPVECARLQGFPDDHAKIAWKGKPVDECPDGHQYKCYGNSMAVPVIAWLGARIEAVLLGRPFTYGIPEKYRLEIESR